MLSVRGRGNADAQVNLGKAYYEGKGVPHSEARAMYYFRLAAKQGNAAAKEYLRVLNGHIPIWGDMGEDLGNQQYNNQVTYNRQTGGRKRHRIRGAIIGILIGSVAGLFIGLSDWHPLVQTIFVLIFMGIGILIG